MERACTKCGVVKPRTFEYFYRQAATSDGFTSWCRECDKEKCRIKAREKRAAGWRPIYNAEKSRAYTAKYKANNAERVRLRIVQSENKRREDPAYRMRTAVARRIRACLMDGRVGSLRHLPYTAEALRKHIERQFHSGMSWENYGQKWHIDHIRPVSSFTCSGIVDEEFLACWALSNLRPLPKIENLSKSSTRTHLL